MCRLFVLWNNFSVLPQWMEASMVGYKKYCSKGLLSSGMIEVGKGKSQYHQEFIPSPGCLDMKERILKAHPDTHTLFYHTRIPMDRRVDSVVVNNIHPFIFDQRYICMHNGMIRFKSDARSKLLAKYENQIKGTTDSELFFALWLSIHKRDKYWDFEKSIRKTLEYTLPESMLNILMFDSTEKKLYAYRGNKSHTLVPPLYMYNDGLTNFRIATESEKSYKIIPKDTFITIDTNKK